MSFVGPRPALFNQDDLIKRGYRDVEIRKDLAGLDRVVTGFR